VNDLTAGDKDRSPALSDDQTIARELRRIRRLLAGTDDEPGLITEVSGLHSQSRHNRWLTVGVLVLVLAVIGIGVGGWLTYRANERNDDRTRAELVARFEAALVAECDSSVDQTHDLRTSFNVLVEVAVDPNDPEAVALGERLVERLDQAIPPRDCAEEARIRAEDG
jgi:hypothetical protein